MVKKMLKTISLIVLIIIFFSMLASTIIFKEPLFPFKFTKYILTYKYANYKINKEDTIKEEQYRNINIKTADEWVHKYFGAVVSEVVECEYIGKRKGWHPDSEFVIHMPFCNDKKIFVESETEKVFTRDFDIATDPKFQHLYSEWVKKQVGIEDENVEFEFTGTYDEPYIDFDKITTLSEDCREVFENTHNFYLTKIIVKNTDISDDNFIDCFNYVKDNIYMKSHYITGKPNKRYTLFIYIDDYRFVYDFPEEIIVSIKKKNKYANEHDGKLWSKIY